MTEPPQSAPFKQERVLVLSFMNSGVTPLSVFRSRPSFTRSYPNLAAHTPGAGGLCPRDGLHCWPSASLHVGGGCVLDVSCALEGCCATPFGGTLPRWLALTATILFAIRESYR